MRVGIAGTGAIAAKHAQAYRAVGSRAVQLVASIYASCASGEGATLAD